MLIISQVLAQKRSGTNLGPIGTSKRHANYKAVGVINGDHTESGEAVCKSSLSSNSAGGNGDVTGYCGQKRKAADGVQYIFLNDEYPAQTRPRNFAPIISERFSEACPRT